jgi:glycosyltransferase involved in cell wall biosynthesis
VVDASRYQKKGEAEKSIFRIGWIGSPSTLKYVKLLVPALEILNTQFALELQLVNGEKGVAYSGKQVLIPWSEETEVGSILQMDIGIMPLPDDPWERGKCAYKLIQYMACGLPVVASPVGMNLEVVVHGENGFLASSVEEWVEYLRKLLEDPSLRARMGEKGRAMVLEKYTLEKNFTKLEKIVGQLIGE